PPKNDQPPGMTLPCTRTVPSALVLRISTFPDALPSSMRTGAETLNDRSKVALSAASAGNAIAVKVAERESRIPEKIVTRRVFMRSMAPGEPGPPDKRYADRA